MPTLTDTFANNLRRARTLRGLTQADLACAASIATGYVSMLERAQRDPPLSTVAQIAAALGVPAIALLTESEGC